MYTGFVTGTRMWDEIISDIDKAMAFLGQIFLAQNGVSRLKEKLTVRCTSDFTSTQVSAGLG
jgi:hypothetical protein